MAMTFSSQGCKQAANDLLQNAKELDRILNTDLDSEINKVRNAYESETATEIYNAYAKMKNSFPDFIDSVTNCSKYLSETVAPAYEKIESTAASKLG